MTTKLKNIELIAEGKCAFLKITGKLESSDYDLFVPDMERQIKQHGKINLLVHLQAFEGWTLGAAWEDTKFGAQHFGDIERLAIVGDKDWEKAMTVFVKPFTRAKVRYFDANVDGQADEAKSWVVGN